MWKLRSEPLLGRALAGSNPPRSTHWGVSADAQLARVLIERGLVSPGQVDSLLASRDPRPLAELLLEGRVVERGQLERVLAELRSPTHAPGAPGAPTASGRQPRARTTADADGTGGWRSVATN